MSVAMQVFAVSEPVLDRIVAEPDLMGSLIEVPEDAPEAKDLPRRSCYLDTAWYAIHIVLTGDDGDNLDVIDDPLAFLLCGGEDIDFDAGATPTRAFRPPEVKTIAEAFRAHSAEAFMERFDHDQMIRQEVAAPGSSAEKFRAYVGSYLKELRTFAIQAMEANECLIVQTY